MKQIVCILLMMLAFCSCEQEQDKWARNAVRDYLKKKGVIEYKEVEWSTPDSVFSPFYLNVLYRYTESKLSTAEAECEAKISGFELNKATYKDSITFYKDSISSIEKQLHDVEMDCIKKMIQKEKNRLGIKLHLVYNNLLGVPKDRTFTFVFENNGKDIGHHLDEEGNLME